MEIILIKKTGVPQAEVEAHQQIQREFTATALSKNWRGYAAFALARSGRGSGDDDFDLVLVTHTNIVVIELKNWHGKRVVSDGQKWYLDGEDRGSSPVEVVNLKAKKLASLISQKLGVARTPFVSAYVVMHGKVDKMELTAAEDKSVLNMTELLSFRFEHCYKQYFWGKVRFNPLDHVAEYDTLFKGPSFKPKEYLIDGFFPESTAIFEHPRKLYAEFRAHAKDDPTTLALLRQWDFGALGLDLIGETDRSFLGLREQRVFHYVSEHNEELSLSLLRPISRKGPKDVTLDFAELFALPARVTRLTEFVHSALPKLGPEERLTLFKAILSRFAELHDLNVAHRDIGDHCLWVDRPAKVVMAGFPSAYYPEMKTVGTFRDKVKVEQSTLPEDCNAQHSATPYHRDVFMLGALAYLILYGEKPPKASGVYSWSPRAEDPFRGKLDSVLARALNHDVAARFAKARDLLQGLNAATASEQENIIDVRAFDGFRAETKERDYPVTESFVDNEALAFFRSEGPSGARMVKVWYGVEPDPKRPADSLRLLAFLERARAVKGCSIVGIPKVFDFGLSRGSLILTLEWVAGNTLDNWSKEAPEFKQRLHVARALTNILERLHAIELAHGDVQPTNIVVGADGSPGFIDLLDFRPNSSDVYTTAYLPANYKSLAPLERDRYSLAAVLVELLGSTRTEPTRGEYPIPRVYEELANLLAAQTLSTLEPLSNALREAELPVEHETAEFQVTIANLGYAGVSPGEIRSDNGAFHVSVAQDRNITDGLRFWVAGIGRQVMFVWKRGEEQAIQVRASPITQSQLLRSQTMRDASVKMRIQLRDGPKPDAQALAQYLMGHKALQSKVAVGTTTEAAVPDAASDGKPSQVEAGISVRELWQALLDTEEDAFFTVTVAGEKRPSPAREHQVLVPYHSDQGVIDYEASEKVMVESQTPEGIWRTCGQLNLPESTFGQLAELAIDSPSLKANFRIGSKLRLVSTLERGSFTRRRLAVDRILQDKAIVPNLVDFFESSDAPPPTLTTYPFPSEADLAVYSEGEKKLNPSQEAAFRKVVGNGPISLLQGPPGTGKTWFIAALMHYLMTKERARRILLVSQSHEAVNTALEKAQELCRSKGIPFDAVRLGSEAVASDAIRHLSSSSIEQSYRENFKAEQRERIVQVAGALGLPTPFSSQMVDLHLRLGMLAERIAQLEARRVTEDDATKHGLDVRIHVLSDTFRHIALEVYEFSDHAPPAEVLHRIQEGLIATHEIHSRDAVERLKALVRLSTDWVSALGSPDANFSEFLAKSRTVVSGTLVGIGYRGASVAQNIYDWVIIDEAARAAPSELAVAIQAGRRILLVGDHRQLPPTFSKEVTDGMTTKFGLDKETALFSSDFERIFESEYGRRVGTTLLTQYRMAPDIGELVSTCFYEDNLESGRGAPPDYYDLLPEHLSKQVTWVDLSTLGDRGYEQTSDDDEDKWNEAEGHCVMGLLRHIIEADDFLPFLSDDLQPMEPAVGIICTYSKQRELIDRMKAEATWLGGARRLVKVDTVDSYQGKENRIVILSTVRNNRQMRPGFLWSPNRINVAMSRAMERLFIVGSTKMWQRRNEKLPLGRVLKKVEEMAAVGRASILSATQFSET